MVTVLTGWMLAEVSINRIITSRALLWHFFRPVPPTWSNPRNLPLYRLLDNRQPLSRKGRETQC